MNEQPWKDLLEGVKTFLGCRLSRGSNDRFTIIVFSTHTQIIYFNKPARDINLSTAKFAEAFRTVHSVITQAEQETLDSTCTTTTMNNKLHYTIIFMSDGQDAYPDRELTSLLENYKPVIEQTMGGSFMNMILLVRMQKLHVFDFILYNSCFTVFIDYLSQIKYYHT
jgi:hypothetical protein